MRILLFLLTSIYLFIAPLQAKIVQHKIDDKLYNFKIPDGYCIMDPNHPLDSSLITTVTQIGRGQVFPQIFFANCEERTKWHEGKTIALEDFGAIAILSAFKNRPAYKENVKQVCGVFKNMGNKVLNSTRSEVNKRIDDVVKGGKINQQTPIGVFGETDVTCSFAVVQKLKTPINTVYDQLSVVSYLLIKNQMLMVAHYSGYKGADAVNERKVFIGKHLADILAANQ